MEKASVSSLVGNMCFNFRFKLEFTSGGGNDLYIDNIDISIITPHLLVTSYQ